MQEKLQIGLNGLIFYLLGLFSTMTALSFGGISVFYMLIVIAFLMRCIELKMKIRFSPSRCKDVLWISFFVLFSMALNVGFYDYSVLEGEWKAKILIGSVVFVFIIMGLSLLYGPNERACLKNYFLDGLYVSCICQLIWAFLELIFWNWAGISLNKVIFQDFLHTGLDVSWTITIGNYLRIGGIGWEPAYFSLAMVAGYLLSSQKKLKLLFILGSIICISRMGVIVMLCTVAIDLLCFNKNKQSQEFLKRIIYLVAGILFFSCWILLIPSIRNIFQSTIALILKWNATISGNVHFLYYKFLPEMLQEVQLTHLLFGYGYGASGLPYMLFYSNVFWNRTAAWSVESEWLSIFWGIGIFGSIAFYSFIIKLIIKSIDKNVKILAICLLIGGVFYVYSGTWLIFYLFLVYDSEGFGWDN